MRSFIDICLNNTNLTCANQYISLGAYHILNAQQIYVAAPPNATPRRNSSRCNSAPTLCHPWPHAEYTSVWVIGGQKVGGTGAAATGDSGTSWMRHYKTTALQCSVAVIPPNLLGICGAPSTGKTTLARMLHRELSARGVECALLVEPARELAPRGVRIDAAMQPEDYEAFLSAYLARDTACDVLGVADRTPVDHYSYLAVNQGLALEFLQRHHDAALAALTRYRVLLYLPPRLRLVDDRFRITDQAYRDALDTAIRVLLREARVPVLSISGPRQARLVAALAAVREHWPELTGAAAAQ